jgi:hypothetical protein
MSGLPRAARSRALQLRVASAAAVLALCAACGGGGGGGDGSSSRYAALCAAPRSGVDPSTGEGYPDRPGTTLDEKRWLRAWIDELYLWYREVPDADPAAYRTPQDYFGVLKTPALTPSGRPKDRFHFWIPTDEWLALSQSGIDAGYGIQWVFLAAAPPRRIVVATVEAGSPAATAGIARGDELVSVDGVPVLDGADVATLNAGTFPSAAGQTHVLGIRGPAGTRLVTLTSANVIFDPVPDVRVLATPTGPVGYVAFSDHSAIAEAQLVSAFAELASAGVTDLVLDLRYNGGGFLAIAAQVGYMVAGPDRTANRVFERLVFNDRFGSGSPFGGPIAFPFVDTTQGFGDLTPGQSLPALGLGRLFVLTGGGTCSASESIVNGLRGVGVQVIQVGATTCGKPYGFLAADNCGTTYFAIQFQGLNAAGFGAYDDGFAPAGAGAAGLPGCAVPDDFGHALGDPAEARLAAALHWRANGACPPPPARVAAAPAGPPAVEGVLARSPAREIRVLGR